MLLSREINNLCKLKNTISDRKFTKQSKPIINKFKYSWIDIMYNLGLYNKAKNTFSLNNIAVEIYGLKCDIFVVPALSFDDLDKNRESIQESLGCMILFDRKKGSSFIKAKFIFNSNKDLCFKYVKYDKPYILYIGNDYSGQPILIDMKEYPHLLITGGTRSGKSVMETVILSNLIANTSEKEVELYLCQIAKSDLIMFEDAKHTLVFADNLDKVRIALEYLVNDEMVRRDKLIRPLRKKALGSNYHDYNKLNKNQKLKTIYVVFDEMASLYQTKGDKKCIKGLKDTISQLINNIASYGASLGVFLICSLQRPTADNLSPLVKSQSTAIVSFRQNNMKSSEVATDDGKLALGLEQREFVYLLASQSSYGIVPWTKDIEAYKIIKNKITSNKIDLFYILKKDGERNIKNKGKEPVKEEPSHIIKTKEQILQENTSKISNFVPYDDPNGKRIVNSIKKGREKIDNR